MKVNAPEKIYLEWYHIGDKKYRDWVITPKTNNEPVEYTRTDVFIEKSKKWFGQQLETYDANGVRVYGDKDFEDFKKYMEGE